MKQGKKLKRDQKVLVSKCGLDPAEWSCAGEDAEYLYLIRKNQDPAEIKVIDKAKKEERPCEPASSGTQAN